jgi:hypothetical protein
MFLLVVVMLTWGGPSNSLPSVESMEIIDTFSSHQNCKEEIEKFWVKVKQRQTVVPENYNMGCIPLNKTPI